MKKLSDGTEHAVPSRCIVGRSSSCGLATEDKYISSEHAKIQWTGTHWELRDLGSRNGTFVDGKRVEPGHPVHIGVGAELGFGEPEPGWRFANAEAPRLSALELSSQEVLASEGEILALPGDSDPEITIYPDKYGRGWVLEHRDGDVRTAEDQEVVIAGGRSWRLELPVIPESTPMVDVALALENVGLRFAVTRNEERVQLTVLLHGKETQLEQREHGYLLLTLARARAQDQALPLEQRGWRKVPEILRMLRMDENAMNVAIHRARQQLASIGLEGAANVVEVKRGQRRIGTERFEITTLED
jgi:hypothetical protein